MNKKMLPKLKNSWVRLDPCIYHHGRGRSLDLQFRVEEASREELLLREPGSTMQVPLPADRIHAYFKEPDRGDRQRHGILSLNGKYSLKVDGGPIRFDPLRRREAVSRNLAL
jgi:hypothetical protein